MGLDTTHGCWHGAYSAFNRWRTAIARQIGLPLNMMEGFVEKYVTTAEVDAAEAALGNARWNEPWPSCFCVLRAMADVKDIPWSILSDDPIVHLLNHSDCGGEIAVEHLLPLANRLEQLLPGLAKLPDDGGRIRNYVEKTQAFIDGLRCAAEANEPVEFR